MDIDGGFMMEEMDGEGEEERIDFVVNQEKVYKGKIVRDKEIMEKKLLINENEEKKYVMQMDKEVGKVERKKMIKGKKIIVQEMGEKYMVKRGINEKMVFKEGKMNINEMGKKIE